MSKKTIIITTLSSVILSAIVTCAVLYGLLFAHFKIDPTTVVRNFEIERATIVGPEGTEDDGAVDITGFILRDSDSDTEYLITDYWAPIQLSDANPQE